MKPIKFNPNDPKLWRDYDPTERATEFVDGKSNKQIAIANSVRQAWQDPEQRKKRTEGIRQWLETDEGKAIKASQWHPQTEESKQKIRNANLGLKKSPELKQKLSDRAKGNQRRCKTIVTKLGTFSSKRIAAEAHTAAGIPNALKKIDHWLKTDPENYYFIDKEGNRLPLEKR